MRYLSLLRGSVCLLAPIGLLSTIYLYYYPVFLRYAFPLPQAPNVASAPSPSAAFFDTLRRHSPVNLDFLGPQPPLAPFRMLTIGDPQLEGDTSIPTTWLGHMPHMFDVWDHITFATEFGSLRLRLKAVFHDIVDVFFEDLYNELLSIRKRVDLIGNDLYLAHVFRTMNWWTQPTHISVLGDLIGSQWIDDAEFKRRGDRYWNTVFKGTEKVPDEVATYPAEEYDLSGYIGKENDSSAADWTRRIINIVGNHDVGYAGDLTEERLARFEHTYGKSNYELRFEYPITDERLRKTIFDEESNPDSTRLVPELRLIIVNNMNLDTPAKSSKLQDDTYTFINDIIGTSSAVEFDGHFSVIMTHIPLLKEEGICVDSPFFDFYDEEDDSGIREQNMLSYDASKGFLEGLLGMNGDPEAANKGLGRPGVILNGHDHAGCDTYHYINQTDDVPVDERRWAVRRWKNATESKIPGADGLPGVREITVRSMMGDFGGNMGLFSAWFDTEEWKWKYEYVACPLGKQHIWWAVHAIDLVVAIGILISGLDLVLLKIAGFDVETWIRGTKAQMEDNVSAKAASEGQGSPPSAKAAGSVISERKKTMLSPPGTPLIVDSERPRSSTPRLTPSIRESIETPDRD
ncbi:Protein TED1 [Ceratocystis platani]|uniref:Protein TED1 n=1 Tax=Ceratocystis fimbriata f. sp. platani TaxID=88771 RepID=A0A0F8DBB2_CERFI|nr:Protein TED1 [Ceratocystis platani]